MDVLPSDPFQPSHREANLTTRSIINSALPYSEMLVESRLFPVPMVPRLPSQEILYWDTTSSLLSSPRRLSAEKGSQLVLLFARTRLENICGKVAEVSEESRHRERHLLVGSLRRLHFLTGPKVSSPLQLSENA
jgi:hypothetical protein